MKMPMNVATGCLKLANVSNDDLRYILGLPTGKKLSGIYEN